MIPNFPIEEEGDLTPRIFGFSFAQKSLKTPKKPSLNSGVTRGHTSRYSCSPAIFLTYSESQNPTIRDKLLQTRSLKLQKTVQSLKAQLTEFQSIKKQLQAKNATIHSLQQLIQQLKQQNKELKSQKLQKTDPKEADSRISANFETLKKKLQMYIANN